MDYWSLVYPSRINWKRFEPDWVVYEEASNQTLAMNACEIDVLMCLSGDPMEVSSLEKQVLDDLQLQDNDETRLTVSASLKRLNSVGLIKQLQDASISNQSR